jgi:transcriptional regulator with XRE-family HTH domain
LNKTEVGVTSLEQLGAMIREDRERLGLSQEELGQKVSVAIGSSEAPGRSTVSVWETGHNPPQPKHFVGLKLVLWTQARQRLAQQLYDAAAVERAA